MIISRGHYGKLMPYNWPIRELVISATNTSHMILLNKEIILIITQILDTLKNCLTGFLRYVS